MQCNPKVRDFTIGIAFAASIATIAIGVLQAFEFYSFAGLNQYAGIAMVGTGLIVALIVSVVASKTCPKSEIRDDQRAAL